MVDITIDKKNFIGKTDGSFYDFYQPLKIIGQGKYTKIFQVENINTKELRVCKQLAKNKISDISKLEAEIEILTQIDHPNIIKIYEVYEDKRYIYIIMEECRGGDLISKILNLNESHQMTEKVSAKIFKQIVSAIDYLHGKSICHRDIKPENFYFAYDGEDAMVKLIDFGQSKVLSGGIQRMGSNVGSGFYIAPEVVEGDYDDKCDIWSAGVILYLMLCGFPPLEGVSFPSPEWDNVSDEAKDLIKKILTGPSKRLTSAEILHHQWITTAAPNSTGKILNLKLKVLIDNTATNALKKTARTIIASRLRDEDVKQLQEIFLELDENSNGMLSIEEFKKGIQNLIEKQTKGIDTDTDIDININIDELFKNIDANHSGMIDYTEFIASAMDQRTYVKEEALYEAFKAIDKDGSGKISKTEIMQVLKIEENESELSKIMAECDLNGDNVIDYAEFVSMMSAYRKL